MTAEIRNIVTAARTRLPNLSSDYADQAIARGKTAAEVRTELLLMMSTDFRAMSKTNMLKQVAQLGLAREEPDANTAASASRANMEAQLRRMGMEPVR